MQLKDDYMCPMCDDRHSLKRCRRFLVMAPHEKEEYIRQNRYCINCLGMSHEILQCSCRHGCRICNEGHHTLLHKLDERREAWLKMTAWGRLQIPGVMNNPAAVRMLIDLASPDSYYIPNLNFPLPLDKLKYV